VASEEKDTYRVMVVASHSRFSDEDKEELVNLLLSLKKKHGSALKVYTTDNKWGIDLWVHELCWEHEIRHYRAKRGETPPGTPQNVRAVYPRFLKRYEALCRKCVEIYIFSSPSKTGGMEFVKKYCSKIGKVPTEFEWKNKSLTLPLPMLE
jgi:hypothetical protein